jgi:multiple sugar transport system substrate-binding protein
MNIKKSLVLLVAFGCAGTLVVTGVAQQSPVKVTVAFDANWRNTLEPLITEYNGNHKDAQIEVLWGGDQAKLIAAQRAPDIIGTGDLYIETQKDLLTDLTPLIAKSGGDLNMSDFFPQMLAPLKVKGKQLALPFRFNVGLLYYNKDLFDAASLKYPSKTWTQKEYLAAAAKLTKADNGRASQWGASTTLGWWGEWLIHVRQAGGDIMKGDTVTLNTPQAIAGLQFFFDKTTAGKYKIAPGPKDDNLGGFAGGKTAMEYGGHTGTWTGLNAVKNLNWDIQVLPRGNKQQKGAEFALEGYGVSSSSKNPDAAWEALKFINSPKFINTAFTKLGLPPSRRSVMDEALGVTREKRSNPKNLEALFDGIKTGMTLPRNKDFVNMAIQVVQPEIDKMLEGKQSAEDTARIAAEKAAKYLASVK